MNGQRPSNLQTVRTTITLYGKITAISGVSDICVTLSPINFSGRVSFNVTTGELKRAGLQCGTIVGVLGNAEIRLPDRNVSRFDKIRLVEYDNTDLLGSTKMIQDRYGAYFDVIRDVDAYVSEQRR